MSIKKNSKFYGQNHQSFRKKEKETDQVLISLVKKPQGCCIGLSVHFKSKYFTSDLILLKGAKRGKGGW